MGIEQYKFVSPGVEVQEIDNTEHPKESLEVGPCVIGRTERGPAMRPVTVKSFSDFIEVFGNPIPGGQLGDVWRDGNYTAPTYAAYAAQAWLKNKSPITVVRTLGMQHENASVSGYAGWEAGENSTDETGGGAYGLFVANSGSLLTCSLGAVFYFPSGGGFSVVGNRIDTGAVASGTSFYLTGTTTDFTGVIYNGSGAEVYRTAFNFDESSEKYIRKVFNTNPTLTNSDITDSRNLEVYWLGETFDQFLNETVVLSGSTGAVALGLSSGSVEYSNYQMGAQKAKSGWIFGQDLSPSTASYDAAVMTRLFYFEALDVGGEWETKNVKVSVQDVKVSNVDENPYGSFAVVVRKANDHDGVVKVLERYTNCNLNPNSDNFVAKKIGDKYIEWSESQRRYIEKGNHENVSKFIRVVTNADVDNGVVDARLLPFGVYGPPKFRDFTVASGSATAVETYAFALGADGIYNSLTSSFVGGITTTTKFAFPRTMQRISSSEGDLGSPKNAYFGIKAAKTDGRRFDNSYRDVLRVLPSGLTESSTNIGVSWYFSLDELVMSGSGPHCYYESGSRLAGNSMTAVSSSYAEVLDQGFDRFTTPLYGGFDGLDITEREAFRNSKMESKTELTSYEINSLRRALDSINDPEVLNFNLLVVPGITNEGVTSRALDICEERGDCYFIMDITSDDSYKPSTEGTTETFDTVNTVSGLKTGLKDRGINTSYGASYYPWVQIKDTIAGVSLWVPPSIPALGVTAYSEKVSQLWFAPAGFNRGGLTNGAAGIPVTSVRYKLSKKERDLLAESNINPIASFPEEGIVIFGQKTLLNKESALSRINVRRLLIYVKKEISKMAASVLFDQNVKTTWNRFLAKAEPFIADIKAKFGLTDAKLVLDETTTTPAIADRNIVYAKCYLKPARSIEHFFVDFNITDTGAAFVD